MKKAIFTFAAACLVFVGFSIRVTKETSQSGAVVPLPDFSGVEAALKSMSTGVTHIQTTDGPWKLQVLPGAEPSHAASANDWLAVRQSATWANSNSNLADQIIVALKNGGLLANSNNLQTTTVINGVTYKLRLQTGGTCGAPCTNQSSSAYSGTKSFTNRLKLWRSSDNLDVLELMFDDVNDPNNGDGVLLVYRLAILSSTVSDNPSLIVESYITGASPSRRQTYSWGAAFWLSGSSASTASDRGRVVLEEMTLGLKGGGTATGLCVKIAARTVSTTLACGTGNYYYALAYGQKTGSNFETTAKSGVALNTLATGGTQCGANLLQFGIFNGQGFVADNLASGSVPSGYPDPSVNGGYPGVTSLFSEINTAGAGANGFDDMLQTKIDGLNAGVTFHPASEAPGF